MPANFAQDRSQSSNGKQIEPLDKSGLGSVLRVRGSKIAANVACLI